MTWFSLHDTDVVVVVAVAVVAGQSCRAAHALQLYFTCNGEAVRQKQHSQHEFVDPMTGVRQLEVKADISRNDVEEYFGTDGYGCQCVAWSSFGQVHSRRAKVVVACEFLSSHCFLSFSFCLWIVHRFCCRVFFSPIITSVDCILPRLLGWTWGCCLVLSPSC